MPPRKFPLVQTVPIEQGTPEFEVIRESLVQKLADSIPNEYYISQAVYENPPKDVTAIPRECGILTAEEIAITEEYDATALAQAIASRKLTAVAVATAFAKRAALASQLTCCLTEWFMDEAVERARALDEYLERTGTVVGPLHGVPVSIKQHIRIAGHWSAYGYVSSYVLDDKDCQMVAILRKLGAVFYCKTNQPQSIMHLESASPLGRVLNPFNIHLSAGGSTGGEAALVALRGSVLGVGTDIGGSVRCPAGFCGIYGFKPTSYTLPMKDFLPNGFAAELNVLCSTGPMCTSLRDMDLFMSLILGERPYLEDPRVIPIQWSGEAAPRKASLRVGFLMNDGDIQPQPPVTRALNWAREQLLSSFRFEVTDFAPWGAARAVANIRKAYWPDGGAGLKASLAATGEPMFKMTQWIIKDAEGPDIGAEGVHQQRMERDKFRLDFAEHWAAQNVDVVICPVFVGPACVHDTSYYWNYTAFWNYVDYPAAVVPTPIRALAKGEEGYAPANATPLSERCKHVRQLWEEGDFEGAPVNLQIVARRYHDNDLFAALESLKAALNLS
ncbi:amidase [Thozetella sp. PMI_491]|nr:amidase [Thozetella sp. PMI_491]